MALKGHKAWNKGIPRTEEVKQKLREARAKQTFSKETLLKMSESQKGRKHSEETKRKMSKWHTGKKYSPETCKRISEAKIGTKASEETKRKLSEARKGNQNAKGFKHTEETRRKVSLAGLGKRKPESMREKMRGEKNHSWNGGITPVYEKIRKCIEYSIWRNSVFKHDNFTCVLCGDNRGGNLEADHYPIPFSAILNKLIVEQGLENLYEKALKYEMFWIIDNGSTLCHNCHIQTDTYGAKAKKKLSTPFIINTNRI